MLNYSVIFFFLYAISTALGQVNCPQGFVENNKNCYRFVVGDAVFGGLTWHKAQAYCTNFIADKYSCHLVVIETAEEMSFLALHMNRDNVLRRRDFWIGLSHIDKSKPWIWSSKQIIVRYNNWSAGEPSGDGSCGYLWAVNFYRWADHSCQGTMDFIYYARRDFWMGLSHIDRAKSWIWSSTQADPQYTNWASRHPEGDGNCGVLWSQARHRWVDRQCTDILDFICEINLE